MTIERGSDWGRGSPLPGGAFVASSDSELRHHVETHKRAGDAMSPIGLVGGDLWSTMGAPIGGPQRLYDNRALTAPVDIASVLLDGRQFWFCSHLVARRSWWRGRVFVVMNAEWIGAWDVATRSHPNDGRLDIYETEMAVTERLKARRRLKSGSHVPHPDISYRSVTAYQTTFDPPMDVRLDGERIGRFKNLTLRVEPDALQVTV